MSDCGIYIWWMIVTLRWGGKSSCTSRKYSAASQTSYTRKDDTTSRGARVMMSRKTYLRWADLSYEIELRHLS